MVFVRMISMDQVLCSCEFGHLMGKPWGEDATPDQGGSTWISTIRGLQCETLLWGYRVAVTCRNVGRSPMMGLSSTNQTVNLGTPQLLQHAQLIKQEILNCQAH